MIYLQIQGRMGNQLFQYAFAKKIQSITDEKIAIDWGEVDARHTEAGDGWENSFIGSRIRGYDTCEIEEAVTGLQKKIYRLNRYLIYNRHRFLKRLHPPVKFISQFFGVYVCQNTRYFHYSYFGSKNKILYGYFESACYFNEVGDVLRREYTKVGGGDNKELLSKIKDSESVCVTIRRGDFFSDKNKGIYGLCDREYFERGMDYILQECKDAVFFFFSDDIEWVKANVSVKAEAYYESGKDTLWEKMTMMSACKHFIISNSTFSWWAQYLSENDEKIVVAPKIWHAGDSNYDIRQDNWTIL